ncbi:hypothetical protein [Jiangella rhizosphaerae]|uniref:Uncharacterized protein n=1 Tax=Jiangella rhizosphaerae TaxID=2293569 RepID=A0A418KMT0_9ACTN|nr:hypothetical protein [Jiangella rhizosphaerae]RIQ20211.1 hypothetical protein DY240_18830 [Jiangella rhizosphaerae]
MTEYVSVNPERLRDLARKLQSAASIVREKTPTIVNGLDGWDATFSGAKLTALADWLDDQWRPMFDRADLAATAANQTRVSASGSPPQTMFQVPYEITEQDMANEGMRDAIGLRQRMNSEDPAIRDAAQREAAEAMEAHADDPAYLQAFFNGGGAEIITTMNRQIVEQGVPPSEQNQNRLRLFSNGVAAVSRFSEANQITLTQGALDPLSSVDNTLQNGIMMQYGPGGDQYGSTFLRTVADSALEWRERNDPPRPSYSEGGVVGTGYVPSGWVQNDDDWWRRIGIDVSYLTVGRDDANRGIDLIQQFDPVNSILTRTGQNPEASRLLLTGDDGLQNAQRLVDYDWQTPGDLGHDDSAPAASVLIAATQDRGPEQGEQSAQAAANVFQAGYDLSRRERGDYDKEQYPELPSSLAEAMAVVGTTYAPDMAASTGQPNVDIHGVVRNPDGTYSLQSNTAVMNGFMKAFMTDPEAAGAFRGAIQGQLTAAARIVSTQPPDPDVPDILTQYGYLNGMVSVVFADQRFTEAEARDAQNKQNQIYFEVTKDVLEAIPLGGEAAEFLRSLATAAGGSQKENLFPTDNADNVANDTQYTMLQDLADMRLFVAQGFVNSGAYPVPEPRPSWVGPDGVIAPVTEQDKLEFDRWWSSLPREMQQIADDANQGFTDATGEFAPDDDRFTPPE